MLQACLAEQQAAFNRESVGRTLAVLLERRGRKPGQLVGRSPYMQAVHVTAEEDLLNRIVEVHIVGAGPNSMAGELALAQGHTTVPRPGRAPMEARP